MFRSLTPCFLFWLLLPALCLTTNAAPVAVDPVFPAGGSPGSQVNQVIRQPDGKLLVAGSFSSFGGIPCSKVIRLLADGTLDTSFNATACSSTVYNIALQTDGKLLVGTISAGTYPDYRSGLARLLPNGSLDLTFDAAPSITSYPQVMEVMEDGRILVGGSFTGGIKRLLANGTPDPSFTPGTGTDGTVFDIFRLPSGEILLGGSFGTCNGVTRNRICRLDGNGVIDPSFGSANTGPGSSVYVIAMDPEGRLIVGGTFSSYNNDSNYSRLARLDAGGTLDRSFFPQPGYAVNEIISLGDGRILVAGDFTSISGITAQRLALLRTDGVPDTNYTTTSGASGSVQTILPLADGKLVIAGSFGSFAGTSKPYLAKVDAPLANGTPAADTIDPPAQIAGGTITLTGSNLTQLTAVDFTDQVSAAFTVVTDTRATVTVPAGASWGPLTLHGASGASLTKAYFHPLPGSPGNPDPSFQPGGSPSSTVYDLALDAAGKPLLAGAFSSIGGTSLPGIARLLTDGSVDPDFAPSGTFSSVKTCELQPNGTLLIGGGTIAGKRGIARLLTNGSLDTSFGPATQIGNSPTVESISARSDGKIVIGGNFTNRVARLLSNGLIDPSFDVGSGASSSVYAVRALPDGKTLVAGGFSSFNSTTARYLTRLLPDGSIDPSFQQTGSGISSTVRAMDLEPDGTILVGGSFSWVDERSAFARLARLESDGALDESFDPVVPGTVYSVRVLIDGRIAVAGDLSTIDGRARRLAAVLHADGELDESFVTASLPTGTAYAIREESDGSLLVAGNFTLGSTRNILRLNAPSRHVRPAISRFSPQSALPGETITLRGSRLGDATEVRFADGSAASFTVVSESEIQATVPPTAMSGPVTIVNPYGETSSALYFRRIDHPLPTITSIPAEPVGQGTVISVQGTHFHDIVSVRIGVFDAEFTVLSATLMQITVPAHAVNGRIIASGPGGVAQSAETLTVIRPTPIISSANQAAAVVGKPFTYQITATWSPIGFGASPLPPGLALDPSEGLISGVPTAPGPTLVTLSATNSNGTGEAPLTIDVALPPAPIVSSASPAYVPVGGRILVSGKNLFLTSGVTVGGVSAGFEVLSDVVLSVVMPAGVSSGVIEVTTSQGTTTSSDGIHRWNFLSGSQTVTGFGDNAIDQLAIPSGLDDVLAISAGPYHNLALRADGGIDGWGANWVGQATPPGDLPPAAEVKAGAFHSLALLADGTIGAWGRDDEGQCSGADGLEQVVAIAAGRYHSVALLSNGLLRAWGADWSGQTDVPTWLGGVIAIDAHGDFTLALKADGTVAAWGDNTYGQTDVPDGLDGVVAIAAGLHHAVALKSDGSLVAWGANWSGQCDIPPGLANVVAISAGDNHSTALLADGSVVAWGDNSSGQAAPPASTDAVAVSAGGWHTLVLHAAVKAPRLTSPGQWNLEPMGAVNEMIAADHSPTIFSAEFLPEGLTLDPATGLVTGTPTTGMDRYVPVTIRNEYGTTRAIVRFFIGPYVIFWGTNTYIDDVPGALDHPVQVAAGDSHALALLADGTVKAWGRNTYGQTTVPAGLDNVVSIAAGYNYSLALKADGTVHGWGRKPGISSLFSNPVFTGIVAISANGSYASAMGKDGRISSLHSALDRFPEDIISANNIQAIADSLYYTFGEYATLTRDGHLANDTGSRIHSPIGGLVLASPTNVGSAYYSSLNPRPIWCLDRNGGLHEFSEFVLSSTTQWFGRSEVTNGIGLAAGAGFVVVLKDDHSVISLPCTADPSYSNRRVEAPFSDRNALVDIRSIAASGTACLAVKDSGPKVRIETPMLAEGRVGQAFSFQVSTNLPVDSFEAPLLPPGLSINSSTGHISGIPLSAGTANAIVIARHAGGFSTGTVHFKFTAGIPPVDLTLSNQTIGEDPPDGTNVGTLTATDPNPDDTFTFSMAGGPGDDDNSSFRISGTNLVTDDPLDYEDKPLLSIRIAATDSGGNRFEKVFTIQLTKSLTDDDDNDGLTEEQELAIGTDPLVRDTDFDGAADGLETSRGSSPLDSEDLPANYVAAWGHNSYQQTDVPLDLGTVVAVAAGGYHSLALLDDGTVKAWGQNSYKQCDVPTGLFDVVAIAAGNYHSLALKRDGTVVTWGSASYDLDEVPAGLDDVVEISACGYLSAALKADGQLVVWGSSSYEATTVPPEAQGAIAVSVGDGHVLALAPDGRIQAWGYNSYGTVSEPTRWEGIRRIRAGDSYSTATSIDGEFQLAGTSTVSTIPASLPPDPFIAPSNGIFVMAIDPNGTLAMWGTTSYDVTEPPVALGPVRSAAGGHYHALALVSTDPLPQIDETPLHVIAGVPFQHTLGATSSGGTMNTSPLPDNCSFDADNHLLSGTIADPGLHLVRVTHQAGARRTVGIVPIICESPSRYSEWRQAALPGNSLSDPLLNPDHDTLSNLLEYALRRNPLVPDSEPAVQTGSIVIDGEAYLTISYERPKEIMDVHYVAEVSSDAKTWSSGPSAVRWVRTIDHGDTETVTLRDVTPKSASPTRLIRLRVLKLDGF